MKKSALLIVGLLFSISASAAIPDYTILADTGMYWKNFQQCFVDSWKAASPTDAQIADAKPFNKIGEDAWTQHKDGVIQGKKDLAEAWSAYPLSVANIAKAEMTYHKSVALLHVARRNSNINTLNLLTADQRKVFDKSFDDCNSKNDRSG